MDDPTMTDFDRFVVISNEDGYIIADEGLSLLYDLFKHLSLGGTINDFESPLVDGAFDCVGILAAAWISARSANDMTKQLGI